MISLTPFSNQESESLARELMDARKHIAYLIRQRDESEKMAFAAAEVASAASKARSHMHDQLDIMVDEVVALKSEKAVLMTSLQELSDICVVQQQKLESSDEYEQILI